MKNLYLLLLSIIIFSCADKDCIGDVTGMYSGTCTSTTGTSEGTMNIFEVPNDDSRVAIEDEVSHTSGYFGELSGNCKTISVPAQSVVDINGQSFELSGTLQVNGSTITGELTFDDGAEGIVCTYDLEKN